MESNLSRVSRHSDQEFAASPARMNRRKMRKGRAIDDARELIARYLGPVADRDFAVRYWDGTVDRPTLTCESASIPTIVLRHASTAQSMFAPPSEFRLGEA